MTTSETKCYVCLHVFDGVRFVKLVYRDKDDLVLTCGELHQVDSDCARTVGLEHVLADDPTVEEAISVPSSWQAERSEFGKPWRKSPIERD
jgi:hypothetical protein